jgi:hypothetical protein
MRGWKITRMERCRWWHALLSSVHARNPYEGWHRIERRDYSKGGRAQIQIEPNRYWDYSDEPPSHWASTSRCNPALRAAEVVAGQVTRYLRWPVYGARPPILLARLMRPSLPRSALPDRERQLAFLSLAVSMPGLPKGRFTA